MGQHRSNSLPSQGGSCRLIAYSMRENRTWVKVQSDSHRKVSQIYDARIHCDGHFLVLWCGHGKSRRN
jgi:hypothetical protein